MLVLKSDESRGTERKASEVAGVSGAPLNSLLLALVGYTNRGPAFVALFAKGPTQH